MALRLGKEPARHDPRTLTYETYAGALTVPASDTDNLHHFHDWLVLGNAQTGDCVWAGAGHETMNWLKIAGRPAQIFTDRTALADYSAVTGYDPRDPSSDQGTVVLDALKFRRSTGIVDIHGRRHQIGGFVALEHGNTQHLREAVFLFDAVGVGFAFPDYAMDQFNAGRPWTVMPGAPKPTEGHYVPAVGFDHRFVYVLTWGRVQRMSWGFYKAFADEAYGILSPEFLRRGRSPEGFALGELQADLAAL